MRTLDEIFGHGVRQRRILFEEGLWCIYEKNDDLIYVIHRCDRVSYALDQGGAWECGGGVIHGPPLRLCRRGVY